MSEVRECRAKLKLDSVERNLKGFLKQRNFSVERRIVTERVVRNIYYIDVQVSDMDVSTIESLITLLQTYRSMRTYEMVTGRFVLRFVFDFMGVLQ